ncbi:MAG: alkaline phosphatase D family protein, partial [Flavobacteriaceae bacterium]
MNTKLALILSFIPYLLIVSCEQKEKPFKIAFGSCASQDHPLPIFNNVVVHQPDVFVLLGDNIYGDTKDIDTLRLKYNQLAAKSSYQNLKENVEIIATWDDHDFGWNDAGKYYEFKEESKEIFLDFFEEPKNSTRRTHQGIYHSYEYDHQGKIIQIILLDGRTFRDDLKSYEGEFDEDSRYFYELEYAP